MEDISKGKSGKAESKRTTETTQTRSGCTMTVVSNWNCRPTRAKGSDLLGRRVHDGDTEPNEAGEIRFGVLRSNGRLESKRNGREKEARCCFEDKFRRELLKMERWSPLRAHAVLQEPARAPQSSSGVVTRRGGRRKTPHKMLASVRAQTRWRWRRRPHWKRHAELRQGRSVQTFASLLRQNVAPIQRSHSGTGSGVSQGKQRCLRQNTVT